MRLALQKFPCYGPQEMRLSSLALNELGCKRSRSGVFAREIAIICHEAEDAGWNLSFQGFCPFVEFRETRGLTLCRRLPILKAQQPSKMVEASLIVITWELIESSPKMIPPVPSRRIKRAAASLPDTLRANRAFTENGLHRISRADRPVWDFYGEEKDTRQVLWSCASYSHGR